VRLFAAVGHELGEKSGLLLHIVTVLQLQMPLGRAEPALFCSRFYFIKPFPLIIF
jgi:hypothetical protein